MQFDKGYCSAHFATDAETLECVLENPFVLIVEKKLSNVKEMVRLLEGVLQSGRALAIIAEDVDGELLATLVLNKLRRVIQVRGGQGPKFRRAAQTDARRYSGHDRGDGRFQRSWREA
jgi:chaperonin GroEL